MAIHRQSMLHRTPSGEAENNTMATDLFVTLFMVMLFVIGSTPIKVKSSIQDETGRSDPPTALYLFVDSSGGIHLDTDQGEKITDGELTQTLSQGVQKKGAKELIVAFPPAYGPAEQIHAMLGRVQDALARPESDGEAIPVFWILSND